MSIDVPFVIERLLRGAVVAVERWIPMPVGHRAGIPHGGLPETPIVTASIGVAVSEPPHADARRVLIRAGHEMLHAKEQGRNRVSALNGTRG
jgi:GGDEF domain-containing protein